MEIWIEQIENSFRFPGQYYDEETGLSYNYFRYYDQTTGRYVTPDPIGLEGGINLFVYVENNPTNFADPDGKNPIRAAKCASYVDKYFKAREECLNECDDSLESGVKYMDKYGAGYASTANLKCICAKMGYDSWGYPEWLRAFAECITTGVKLSPKPTR